MQFRKQKSLVQVMRYEGYKKDTKQPVMKMVGVIDLTSFKFKLHDGFELNEIERLEVNQAIEREQLVAVQERAAHAAMQACEGLRTLNPATDLSTLIKNDPEAIWRGLIAIEKALKAGGFEKPKRVKVDKVPDTKTGNLLWNALVMHCIINA